MSAAITGAIKLKDTARAIKPIKSVLVKRFIGYLLFDESMEKLTRQQTPSNKFCIPIQF
jgi:hypothetical protein